MKARLTIGITLFFLVLSIQSYGQATAYANIYATVVAPVGLTASNDLSLGSIEVTQKSAGLSLQSETEITASGFKLGQDGTALLASFSITDNTHATFDITLPSNDLVIGSQTANTMIFSDFSSSSTSTNRLQSNCKEINIAASVRIPENQMIGNYCTQNPFPVTLNYN